MELFENEIINISRILNVAKYEATAEFEEKRLCRDYSINLKTYELVFFVSGGSNTEFCGVEILDCPGSMRYLPKGKGSGDYTVNNIKKGYCIDIYFDTEDEMPNEAIGFLKLDHLAEKFIKIYII